MSKPTAVKDTNKIFFNDADSKVGGNILANDTAAPGDTLFLRFLDGARIDDTGKKGTNTVVGDYGTFKIFSDGSYTYTLDHTNAAVIALGAGGPDLVEKVSYKVSNGAGETDFDYLTIDIVGPNTKPTAVDDAYTTVNNTVIGNVLDNDLDAEGGLAVARAGGEDTTTVGGPIDFDLEFIGAGPKTVEGVYGDLTIKGDGTFIYVVDATDPDTIALNGGTAVDTFQYRIRDDAFGSVPNANSTDVGLIHITVQEEIFS